MAVPPDAAAAICTRNAGKLFLDGAVVAFRQMTIEVHRQEILCIVGPSGCGKTSFLRAIAGLTDLSARELLVFGRRVAGPPQGVAMVPERGVRARHGGRRPRPYRRAGAQLSRSRRAYGFRAPIPVSAFRRHAAARRPRPGARRQPVAGADLRRREVGRLSIAKRLVGKRDLLAQPLGRPPILRLVLLHNVEDHGHEHNGGDDGEARNVPGERRYGRREEQNQDQWIAQPFDEGGQQALRFGRLDSVRPNRLKNGSGVGRCRWNAAIERARRADGRPAPMVPALRARLCPIDATSMLLLPARLL
jgi:energy-coupling factor transporter ATP-binding protein EcfA2